jgi:hypothetical protein
LSIGFTIGRDIFSVSGFDERRVFDLAVAGEVYFTDIRIFGFIGLKLKFNGP